MMKLNKTKTGEKMDFKMKINEIKTELLESISDINSKHYDDVVWKQGLINVLNQHLKEIIQLENDLEMEKL